MDKLKLLNDIYEPLHKHAKELLSAIKGMGYSAKLSYCNMHEVKVGDKFLTEYFPMPEIEIHGIALSAELGISFDYALWLELTISRDKALYINYSELAKETHLEVYGAENYLLDFYNPTMDICEVTQKIECSCEDHIHLCFRLKKYDISDLKSLFEFLVEQNIIQN